MRLLLICAALMTGCATTTDPAFLQAQLDAQKLAVAEQKPLVRFTAQPGQAITGLASFEVYMPTQATQIQQSRPNEWAGVVSQSIGVLGTLGGIYYAGKAAVGLASTVGSSNAAIAGQIQAPGAVTTTNIGQGAYSPATTTTTSTATPTVVNQPAPLVITQPQPLIVTQPQPVIVNPVIVP